MRKKINWTLIVLSMLVISFHGCTTKKKIIDDDFAVDSADAGLTNEDLAFEEDGSAPQATDSDLALEPEAAPQGDEFSDFDNGDSSTPAESVAEVDPEKKTSDDLDKELNQLSDSPAPAPEIVEAPAPPAEVPVPAPVIETPPPVEVATQPEEPTPVVEAPKETNVLAHVTNVQYKGNSNGGTVVITADQPINYTTRLNSATNQIVVEANNVIISDPLKRPLNTKDMSSSIGHIDIYQKKGSQTARFVIQLRPNSPEPLVQPEGNSLLIVGSPASAIGTTMMAEQKVEPKNEEMPKEPVMNVANNTELNNELNGRGIMGSDDLETFLTNNNKFYGRKISIEAPDLDVREVLEFIAEESGVNMVFDDKIEGKTTLKLRKVPWDQAFVTVLKSKKLSYRRQGSILRIALQDDLIKEDEAAVKLKEGKISVEPLVVKNFSINYAKPAELKTKIEDFIKTDGKLAGANRGKVTADDTTGTLIITETQSNLKNIAQLIKILDAQPQQVMIEAKIIEASESFKKSIGGRIGLNRSTGAPGLPTMPTPFPNGRTALTTGGASGNFISPGIAAGPATTGMGGSFLADLVFGTIGAFGNLDAQLALNEIENKIKIISSPRISVISTKPATIEQSGQIIQRDTVVTSTTGTVTTPNYAKVGVKLTVTPTVSNIGTVKMAINVSRTAGDADKTTTDRSMSTEVVVKNNDTVVIGGVFTADVYKTKEGVPGLKDIPILGTLFKGEEDSNAKTELMIFVTPKIIPTLTNVFKAESAPAPVSTDGELQL